MTAAKPFVSRDNYRNAKEAATPPKVGRPPPEKRWNRAGSGALESLT